VLQQAEKFEIGGCGQKMAEYPLAKKRKSGSADQRMPIGKMVPD